MRRKLITAVLAAIAAISLASCEEDGSSAVEKERKTQDSGYNILTEKQPAKKMEHSPTRETINFWIDTWDKPNKLSYVYLQGANGELLGYYVLEGLPVSYCASLSPTYKIVDRHQGDVVVPAPAMDGVYYSGAECNTYYGIDATTGTYLEWTAGLGINTLLFEEPMPRQNDVLPLGPTTVEDAKKASND